MASEGPRGLVAKTPRPRGRVERWGGDVAADSVPRPLVSAFRRLEV